MPKRHRLLLYMKASRRWLWSYLFEGGEQLDADETELVASHVLQQKSVVLQVLVRQVELNLSHQLLNELWVWRLPALVLQLAAAGPSTAEGQKAALITNSSRQFNW